MGLPSYSYDGDDHDRVIKIKSIIELKIIYYKVGPNYDKK